MSNALWCDPGGHAFPAGQPGSTTIKLSEQVKNQWGGSQPSDTVSDVCAACALELGYRGLAGAKLTPQQEQEQAEEVREGSGGWRRFRSRTTPSAPELTTGEKKPTLADAEQELERVRLDELERRLNEVEYGKAQ